MISLKTFKDHGIFMQISSCKFSSSRRNFLNVLITSSSMRLESYMCSQFG